MKNKKLFVFFIILFAAITVSGAVVSAQSNVLDQPINLDPYPYRPANPPAPSSSGGGDFSVLIDRIIGFVIKPLIALIWALSLLYFLWNVVRYLQSGMSEGDREEIRKTVAYSLLALFVMSSVWGLVWVIDRTLGLDDTVIDTPRFFNN